MDKISEDSQKAEDLLFGTTGIFAPENIFWAPSGKIVREFWQKLWNKALAMGWSLLAAGLNREVNFSGKEFLLQLSELKDEIRESLFREIPVIDDVEKAGANRAIREILLKIAAKWRSVPDHPAEEKETVSPTTSVETESAGWDDIPSTTIISPQQMKMPETETVGNRTEEKDQWADIPPTTIIKPQQINIPATETVENKTEEKDQWADIPPTTIIKPQQMNIPDTETVEDKIEDQWADMPPTTIIKPQQMNIPDTETVEDKIEDQWTDMPPTRLIETEKDRMPAGKKPESGWNEILPTAVFDTALPNGKIGGKKIEPVNGGWDDFPETRILDSQKVKEAISEGQKADVRTDTADQDGVKVDDDLTTETVILHPENFKKGENDG